MARTVSNLVLPATSAPVKVFRDASNKNVQAVAIASQLDADSDPLGDPTDALWTGGPGSLIALAKAIAIAVAGGVTLTDASIADATGASQEIAPANSNRNVLNVHNIGGSSWWINETGGDAAENTEGSWELKGGESWCPRPAPRNSVKAIGTENSKLTVSLG